MDNISKLLSVCNPTWRIASLLLMGLPVLAGCQDQLYDTAPVSGKVLLDGKPLTEGKVIFTPVAVGPSTRPGNPGQGELSSNGEYSLSTKGGGEGAVVGGHWVTVVQTILPKNAPGATPDTSEPVKFVRYKFPDQITVVEGQDNKIDILLTSEMLTN